MIYEALYYKRYNKWNRTFQIPFKVIYRMKGRFERYIF